MTIWQRFRAFRRSRPFWGGVLTILAGLEIIGSMNLELHGGTISIGQEGFTGYLIAFILIIAGPLAWFLPTQRHFYGLVATFVAIYSLIGVNLGGFFIGMLLGVAGGGLIFAWSPAEEALPSAEEALPPAEEPTAELAIDEDIEPNPKAPSPRHAAMMIIAVALTASMATVAIAQGQAGAAQTCDQPAPSASPSPSTPSGSGGTIIGDIIDFFDRLFGGGRSGTPAPTPTPTPSVSPAPCPTPSGSAAPAPTATPSPAPSATRDPVKVLKAAAGQPPVAKRPSRMTGTRVTMTNLVFKGVVDLPTVDGSIRVLWFTMTRSDTNDFLLHVYGKDGWDTDLKSSRLTVRGDIVHFYTSRFQANLLGLIPVDYTPENLPPPIPLPIVFFTNPVVQLVWVDSPVLEAPNLRITLVRS